MAKDALVQIRMDSKLKEDVESLYRDLGTSFTEAIRIFAVQSLKVRGMPFRVAEPQAYLIQTKDEVLDEEATEKRDYLSR